MAADASAAKRLMDEYAEDGRVAVQKLVAQQQKRVREQEQELERLCKMNRYEELCYENGCRVVAGIDEVGRGPLAGPVVACAVVLKRNTMIPYVNDSKKLSERKRLELSGIIKAEAEAFALGVVDAKTIDQINILQATHLAMRVALKGLGLSPEHLLIDGVYVAGMDVPQTAIVQGDSKSISIAAASIVAKVHRDELMTQYDKSYPGYGFASNKGYGSEGHIEAIRRLGLSPIHRRSFTKSFA